MTHEQTTVDMSQVSARPSRGEALHLAIVRLWCSAEPERTGELVLLTRRRRGEPAVLGRGEASAVWVRQRPGEVQETGPLGDTKLSRRQLEIRTVAPREVEVLNVGRGQLQDAAGAPVDRCRIRPGQSFGLAGRALFMLIERPAHLPTLESRAPAVWPTFGEADALGFVGESPPIWALRRAIVRLASQDEHTLVLGATGVGKELTARGLHSLSARSTGPWIAHNAAAIPEGLVAAELFGNCRGYPNPGTPERAGLIGAADNGVLMLDEIGELSMGAQAALLRVLDGDGEYQRLGESRARRSDVRVIGATNRTRAELKPDFSARFQLQLELPNLAEHPEDIPLLCRHLLKSAGIERSAGEDLVRGLITAKLQGQVRGLRAILLRAHHASEGGPLGIPPGGLEPVDVSDIGSAPSEAATIRQALAAHFGDREATAKALGLSSRYVLYRLMKAHGIEA
jgi:DNA-binding NtrC family response regulator